MYKAPSKTLDISSGHLRESKHTACRIRAFLHRRKDLAAVTNFSCLNKNISAERKSKERKNFGTFLAEISKVKGAVRKQPTFRGCKHKKSHIKQKITEQETKGTVIMNAKGDQCVLSQAVMKSFRC